MQLFNKLPSIKEGYLLVDHSLGAGETLDEARYLLFSPHDASGEGNELGLNRVPSEVKRHLTHEATLLEEYFNQERDVGMNELGTEILKRCPGGVRVSAELNRGLCNASGVATGPFALPEIWSPEGLRAARPLLEKIHRSMIGDLDVIFAGLKPGARIICLHSMDPWGFEQGTRPPLSHASMKEYVAAQGWSVQKKIPRKEDFISGQEEDRLNADLELYQALQKLFDKNEIPWAINEPYGPDQSCTDFQYMQMYPGRVSTIYLTKSSLCVGDIKTFDPRNPKVDPHKVAFMAELHSQVINGIIRL